MSFTTTKSQGCNQNTITKAEGKKKIMELAAKNLGRTMFFKDAEKVTASLCGIYSSRRRSLIPAFFFDRTRITSGWIS